jgi:hypothetical protein
VHLGRMTTLVTVVNSSNHFGRNRSSYESISERTTEVVGKHGIFKHNHNYNNNNNTSSVSLLKTNIVINTSSVAGSFSPVAVGAGSSPSSLSIAQSNLGKVQLDSAYKIYWSSLAWSPRFLIQSKLDLFHWFERASSRYNESTTSVCREPF